MTPAEKALGAQRLMGALFLAMGAGCVVASETVLDLSLREPTGVSDNATSRLLFQCFGAQAILCGTLLSVAELGRRGFAVWGSCMLPFVAFDAYYYLFQGCFNDVRRRGRLVWEPDFHSQQRFRV